MKIFGQWQVTRGDDYKNKLYFKHIAYWQYKGSQIYLVGEWLGLITLTDEAFIRGSKFRSIVVDIKDPDGHWNFGFLMSVV